MKYFITTFLALSSTLCLAQDTSTPASLFPQSNAAQPPILTAEPEVVLREATGVIIGEEEPLLETTDETNTRGTDSDAVEGTNRINLEHIFSKPKDRNRTGILRAINLDLYERDIKLFSGFRSDSTDQVGKWVRLDYLISWRRGTRIPALATTSSAGLPLKMLAY